MTTRMMPPPYSLPQNTCLRANPSFGSEQPEPRPAATQHPLAPYSMLRRKPTRIELRPEDKQEYGELKKAEKLLSAASQHRRGGGSTAHGGGGGTSSLTDSAKKQAIRDEEREARIGLS